jgi:hypothetical protein
MRKLIVCLVLAVWLSALALALAPEKGEWQGWVTDESCGKKGYNNPNHASCAKKCFANGKKAALAVSEDKIIILDITKDKAEEFAGANVKVTGTLDSEQNTIKVDSIEKTK